MDKYGKITTANYKFVDLPLVSGYGFINFGDHNWSYLKTVRIRDTLFHASYADGTRVLRNEVN